MAEYRQEFIADPPYFYNDDNTIYEHKLRKRNRNFLKNKFETNLFIKR